ncbi:hypothetical protein HK097_007031 [Rhizophlyctis rosea]|uniref:Major facilitator superfamily (MFS) profile domain-containing protein n=1 Tax=Rhizophlyctis rosea TaxID=64517 RepID=A0AAD5X8S1_9FUNG|nr:hypothetical protein HK097_007031 [Rhizophlyctis rosea]
MPGGTITKGSDNAPQGIDLILEKEKPNAWAPGMKKMYFFLFFAFWGSAMNGFDGSLFGSIYHIPQFSTEFWGHEAESPFISLLNQLYTLGAIAGAFFAGPATDQWGRRKGMAIGAIIVIIGTIICATIPTPNGALFGTGRFLCGFGVTIASTAAPAYVIEIAHPAYRGAIGGIYNTLWFAGNILVTWIAYATIRLPGSQAWRLPFWTQLVPAGIVLIGSLIIPESPRWLISRERPEDARKILVDLHASGNADSELVALEMEEMTASIKVDGTDKRFWDYSGLVSTGAARYRMLMVFFMAFFGQMSGSNMFSYFGATVLKAAGFSDAAERQLFNGIQTVVQFGTSQIGVWAVNKLGRRSLIIPGTVLFSVWLSVLAAASKFAAPNGVEDESSYNRHWGAVAVAAMFLFQITNSIAWTPMQALYPVECLETTTRAKGMGMNGLILQAAIALNTFVIPLGIKALTWKFYFIFIIWDLIEALLMWAFMVETKGLTLEELEDIFQAPNPKQASLERQKVIVSEA